jgi:hypothetical protein
VTAKCSDVSRPRLRPRFATSSIHKKHHQQGLLFHKITGLRFTVLEAKITRCLFLHLKPIEAIHGPCFVSIVVHQDSSGLRFTVLESTTTRFLLLNPKLWKLYTAHVLRPTSNIKARLRCCLHLHKTQGSSSPWKHPPPMRP